MVCSTIQNKTFGEIAEMLSSMEMAEIRLDRCSLSDQEIQDCFLADIPLVATCRIAVLMSSDPSLTPASAAALCEARLIKAVVAGASYVDVEIEAPKQMVKRVAMAAKENGAVMIRSYHDMASTGSAEELRAMAEKCRCHGGEIVKIATTAAGEEDAERVLSLYEYFEPSSLIAFCMGEKGSESRIGCLSKGAPFTYAAVSEEEKAAPGQLLAEEMERRIYGDMKFFGYPGTGKSHSDMQCPVAEMPASKSFAQRAIIAASLAEGVSRLRGYTECGDNMSAVEVARTLGADVSKDGDVLIVRGAGAAEAGRRLDECAYVNVGESGLLTRLMIPLSGLLASRTISIDGDKTLSTRTLSGVRDIMSCFGVGLSGSNVPLETEGRLSPARGISFSGEHGSQVISGLLMSLPLAEKNSSFTVYHPVSIPYIFITADILRKFGIRISDEMIGGDDFLLSEGNWSFCNEILFKIKGGQKYHPADIDLEGDWSTAANFLVAGAVFGRAEVSGLDMGSIQADLSIMDILTDAGSCISQYDSDTGNVFVQRAPLRGFSTDASDCPDLFPILSVLAAFSQGTSTIKGISRLTHKESDRGKAILNMLEQMGVDAEIKDNALVVEGRSLACRRLTGSMLKGGKYTSHHDHRMAMALAVASLGADSPIEIDDKECVSKSCPAFFTLFDKFLS